MGSISSRKCDTSERETRKTTIREIEMKGGLKNVLMNRVRSANGSHFHVLQNELMMTLNMSKMLQIKKIKGTQKIYYDENYIHKGMRLLSKDLMDKVSLQSLHLNLNEGYRMTDRELSAISQGFRSLTSLQTLSIKYYSCYSKITSRGLSALSKNFKMLISLKSLTLDFENISDETFASLSRGIGRLSTLQSLTIQLRGLDSSEKYNSEDPSSFGSENNKNEGFSSLSQQFKKLSSLKSLTLILSGVIDGVVTSLIEGFKTLISLQTLALDVRGIININPLFRYYRLEFPWIEEGWVRSLGTCLRALDSLQDLTLYLRSWPHFTEEIQYFCECIRAFTNLQSLTLGLRGPVKEDLKKFMMNELKTLKPLKTKIVYYKKED